jgi:hypothetical protein
MKSWLRSAKPVQYESTATIESKALPGVRFTIYKLSFARRCLLAAEVRQVGRRLEYLQAGTSVEDRIEAAAVMAELDGIYLRWGLASVRGLLIDGAPATPITVHEHGPEPLAREIVTAIQAECGLNDNERKN